MGAGEPFSVAPKPLALPISIMRMLLRSSPSIIIRVSSGEKPLPTTLAPSRRVQSMIFIVVSLHKIAPSVRFAIFKIQKTW